MEKVCRWLVEKVVVRILCYGLALLRSEPVEPKRQIFGKTQNLSITKLFFYEIMTIYLHIFKTLTIACNIFGPKLIWCPYLALHNGSPLDKSLSTNGPQPIQSPWTNDPPKLGPHGQMVPNQFGFHGQMVPRIFRLFRGIGCGDPKIWGLNLMGTIYPGEPNFGGPFVHEDQI